jgi:hypothetical protein
VARASRLSRTGAFLCDQLSLVPGTRPPCIIAAMWGDTPVSPWAALCFGRFVSALSAFSSER